MRDMKHFASALSIALVVVLTAWSPCQAVEPLKLSLIEHNSAQEDAFLILREAYRRLGIDIQAVPLPAERALRSATAGATCGEVARMEGLESIYPDLLRVPEPLIFIQTLALTLGMTFPVDGWQSLRPYRLCYTHGVKIYEESTAGMLRMPSTGAVHSIQLMRQGLCEVTLIDSWSWSNIDKANVGPVRELEPAVAVTPLYHYLHHRYEAMVPLVAEELRKMREEGVIQAILKPGVDAALAAKARQTVPSVRQ